MLLSRFWYVVLSLLLGAAAFVLFLAGSMYNRSSARTLGERLSADSQVVSWYLKNDARERSSQLVKFALNRDIAKCLDESSKSEAQVPEKCRDKVADALRDVNEQIDKEFAFDAVFAVDQHGRVVAHLGYEQASGMEDFELGGYPVVADALHGYIRDDTLVLDRLYRVAARPVEFNLGQLPAGAIVGARIIDDRFARELSSRTGAAVAFFTKGQRVASGAPEGFDRSQLDQIAGDMGQLESDQEYQDKGRSKLRMLDANLGIQYTRLPGEAYALGAGFAVGRKTEHVSEPLDFFREADDKDKEDVNLVVVLAITLGAVALGLFFSYLEHSRPLAVFRREAIRLARGQVNQLLPSRFRGVYRKIASDLNDGIDEVAAKGGIPRGAANLKQVLGDLPKEPQMSAFSFPGEAARAGPESARTAPVHAAAATPPAAPAAPVPPPVLPMPPSSGPRSAKPLPKPPPTPAATKRLGADAHPSPPAAPVAPSPPVAHAASSPQAADPEAVRLQEWRKVYEDFVATKQQCGESIEGFSYEKFEKTLKKNQTAIMKRHGAKRVKFAVYVKEGRAALKASPIRG
jgi:hypothetical protein